MERLPNGVDAGSADFARRRDANASLVEELTSKLDAVRESGDQPHILRHRDRGKMLPRERIAEVCDSGSPCTAAPVSPSTTTRLSTTLGAQ